MTLMLNYPITKNGSLGEIQEKASIVKSEIFRDHNDAKKKLPTLHFLKNVSGTLDKPIK
jgi:hypothetical protein